eukprot:1157093-Pelagomonas_calceolata.AAC.6
MSGTPGCRHLFRHAGVLRQELSNLSGLQKAHGAYVGGLAGAPKDVTAKLDQGACPLQSLVTNPTPALCTTPNTSVPQGQLSASRGGPFALLNGGAARDALVVSLPQGVAVETPLCIESKCCFCTAVCGLAAQERLAVAAADSSMSKSKDCTQHIWHCQEVQEENLSVHLGQLVVPYCPIYPVVTAACLVSYKPALVSLLIRRVRVCTCASHLAAAGAPGTTNSSAPRMLLHAGKGASCTLIEEFVGLNEDGTAAALEASPEQAQQPPYLCNNVAEMFLESKSQVTHSLASRDGPGGANFKSTFVSQGMHTSITVSVTRCALLGAAFSCLRLVFHSLACALLCTVFSCLRLVWCFICLLALCLVLPSSACTLGKFLRPLAPCSVLHSSACPAWIVSVGVA